MNFQRYLTPEWLAIAAVAITAFVSPAISNHELRETNICSFKAQLTKEILSQTTKHRYLVELGMDVPLVCFENTGTHELKIRNKMPNYIIPYEKLENAFRDYIISTDAINTNFKLYLSQTRDRDLDESNFSGSLLKVDYLFGNYVTNANDYIMCDRNGEWHKLRESARAFENEMINITSKCFESYLGSSTYRIVFYLAKIILVFFVSYLAISLIANQIIKFFVKKQ